MKIEKDKKGPCWIISHERSGYDERIWVTIEEVRELFKKLKEII